MQKYLLFITKSSRIINYKKKIELFVLWTKKRIANLCMKSMSVFHETVFRRITNY